MQTDLKRLKEKVDAGADYVVTQMFFDNEKYFKFVDAAKKAGINVPIIPGIKPIAIKKPIVKPAFKKEKSFLVINTTAVIPENRANVTKAACCTKSALSV